MQRDGKPCTGICVAFAAAARPKKHQLRRPADRTWPGFEISSLDTDTAIGYGLRKLPRAVRGARVRSLGIGSKVLLRLGLLSAVFLPLPVLAQTAKRDLLYALAETGWQGDPLPAPLDLRNITLNWMPENTTSYFSSRARWESPSFEKAVWTSNPGTIQRMEAAFSCNDTPFVDQVRLPLATLWRGRLKLTGFESDVTTANFVLGLPGQGSLHSLSAFGNAFIATHTPPSDQLAGIHMTFSWRPSEMEPTDNSGRRGIEYLVRASRSALPFLGPRPEAVASAVR